MDLSAFQIFVVVFVSFVRVKVSVFIVVGFVRCLETVYRLGPLSGQKEGVREAGRGSGGSARASGHRRRMLLPTRARRRHGGSRPRRSLQGTG